jgi:hypothetical protein
MILDGQELEFYKYNGEVGQLLDAVRVKINALAESWTPEQKKQCLEVRVGAWLVPSRRRWSTGGQGLGRGRLAAHAAWPSIQQQPVSTDNWQPTTEPRPTATTAGDHGDLQELWRPHALHLHPRRTLVTHE